MTPDESPAPAEDLPAYRIERARSSRSRCKSCRKPIQKDKPRFGVRIEGPFGPGFLWHHLSCAARRRFEDVEAAYRDRMFEAGLELPPLEELKDTVEQEAQRKSEQRLPPYLERAPSGRSKCKACGEGIEQGAPRVVVLRKVEFGNQVRTGPAFVHPRCVPDELDREDSATEKDGFLAALKANSGELDESLVDRVIAEIGPLGGD